MRKQHKRRGGQFSKKHSFFLSPVLGKKGLTARLYRIYLNFLSKERLPIGRIQAVHFLILSLVILKVKCMHYDMKHE
jgi:hypothetical protein